VATLRQAQAIEKVNTRHMLGDKIEKLEKAFTELLGQEEMSSYWCGKLDTTSSPSSRKNK
jgi:hypothetical protein